MADENDFPKTKWAKAAPAFPPEVAEATEALEESLRTAREAVRAARLVVTANLALASTEAASRIDLGNAALQALIAAARAAVDALLDDVGVYVLLVPLPKKGLAAWLPNVLTGTPDPPAADADPELANVRARAQAARVGTPLGGLGAALGRRVADLPVWQRAFAPEALFTGGNAHFLKTVAESVTDADDELRPAFGQDSYWGYLALVGGATDVAAAAALAPYVLHLFGSSRDAGALAATRGDGDIVATGVAVRPYPRGGAVALTWTPLDDQPLDDGWRAVPHQYAVVRSERPEAMGARQLLDLFPSTNLRRGLAGRHGARVLKVAGYSPVVHRYVDETDLVAGQVYYYHLVVRAKLLGPRGQEKLMPWGSLSSAARYRPSPGNAPPARRGVPPDWYRSPSVVRVVPALGELIDVVNAAIDSATSASDTVTGITRAAIDALDQLVAKLDRIVSEIDTVTGQILSAYTSPDANIHTVLRTGKGNVTSMVGDLAQALDDRTDENRPSFDTGDEYVFGAMVVAAAPSEAAFLRAWTLVELLFAPSEGPDPVLAGIEQFTQEAARVFESLPATEPARTFGEDMAPRPVGQGDASCE